MSVAHGWNQYSDLLHPHFNIVRWSLMDIRIIGNLTKSPYFRIELTEKVLLQANFFKTAFIFLMKFSLRYWHIACNYNGIYLRLNLG